MITDIYDPGHQATRVNLGLIDGDELRHAETYLLSYGYGRCSDGQWRAGQSQRVLMTLLIARDRIIEGRLLGDPLPDGEIDERDPRCPRCGEELYRHEVDIGIGTEYGPWGCNDCGWSIDRRYDRSDGQSIAAAEHPDCLVDQFGGITPMRPVQAKLLDRFGISVDLVGEGEDQS